MARPEGSPEAHAYFDGWVSLFGIGGFDETLQLQWGSFHTDIATAFAEWYHQQKLAEQEQEEEL